MSRPCPACAKANPDDSGFCQYCGGSLAPDPAAAPVPAGYAAPAPTPGYAVPAPTPGYAVPDPTQAYAAPPPGYATAPPGPTAPPGAGGYGAQGPLPSSFLPPQGFPQAGPVATGPGISPPPGPGAPHRRLRPLMIAGIVAGVLVVAVVVGLVIPKVGGGSHKPIHPTAARVTSGTTPAQTPPAAVTPTSVPTATAPASPSTTAAPTPAPGGGTGGTGGSGQTIRNRVVEVTLPTGWTVSHSASTSLVLAGQDATNAGFQSQAVAASTTLSQVVQSLTGSLLKSAPDAKVCTQPQNSSVPGGIKTGAAFGVCATETGQGQQARPVEVLDFVGLAKVSTGEQLYLVELVFPQTITSSQFKALYSPLLGTVRWATG